MHVQVNAIAVQYPSLRQVAVHLEPDEWSQWNREGKNECGVSQE